MERILAYGGSGIAEQLTPAVRETPAGFREELEAKTEQYLQQLRELEQRCLRPDADHERLLDEVTMLNDAILQACAVFEERVGRDPAVLREARRRFREQTSAMLSKSHFINNARTWPRGYQGDYQMLEDVYRDLPMVDGIGMHLDRYSLSTSLAVAVRERRATLRALLQRELARRRQPNVLDIACGSCREVFELAPEIIASNANFTCLDLDPAALEFASNRMPFAGIDPDRMSFRRYNALKMVNVQRNLQEFGKQDVIYSVGFFDYLPDELLVRLFRSLYETLNPGGLLIMSFKDRRRYGSQYYHWMVDWDGFLLRGEEDSRRLVEEAGIPADRVETLRDASQVIIFYNASKP